MPLRHKYVMNSLIISQMLDIFISKNLAVCLNKKRSSIISWITNMIFLKNISTIQTDYIYLKPVRLSVNESSITVTQYSPVGNHHTVSSMKFVVWSWRQSTVYGHPVAGKRCALKIGILQQFGSGINPTNQSDCQQRAKDRRHGSVNTKILCLLYSKIRFFIKLLTKSMY